jgi:hypothetical protein
VTLHLLSKVNFGNCTIGKLFFAREKRELEDGKRE